MRACIRVALGLAAISLAGEAAATEWNVSLWGKRRAFTEHVEKLAELVSARTNGEFTFNIDYGGLSKNTQNLDGISKDSFEMAQFCAGYHPDKNPSLTVLELPFLGVETLEQEIAVSQAVYRHPATIADLGRWNATLLMPSPLPQYNLAGIGEPPSSLYSLRGLKVRATGGIAESMKVVNAEPIGMSATEVQVALESKFISAVAFAPHAHMAFGTIDQAEWWTSNLNPGTVHCPVVASTTALNALSQEHREALFASIDEALDHYVENYRVVTMEKWDALLDEKELTKVTFNNLALEALRDAAERDAVGPWLEKTNAQGLPADELLAIVRQTVAAES